MHRIFWNKIVCIEVYQKNNLYEAPWTLEWTLMLWNTQNLYRFSIINFFTKLFYANLSTYDYFRMGFEPVILTFNQLKKCSIMMNCEQIWTISFKQVMTIIKHIKVIGCIFILPSLLPIALVAVSLWVN